MSTSALPARSILRHYRAATDETRALGGQWYPAALKLCQEAAVEREVDVVGTVCALAHLSPRTSWAKNVEAFSLLLAGESQPGWVLTRSWTLAAAALVAEDPWSTFGRRASKTRAFAQAILGDPNAVTVDVWAARVAGVDPDILSRPRDYQSVADAYIRAARRVGVSPRDLQAICWVEIRESAA
jgi:hypothetical protein